LPGRPGKTPAYIILADALRSTSFLFQIHSQQFFLQACQALWFRNANQLLPLLLTRGSDFLWRHLRNGVQLSNTASNYIPAYEANRIPINIAMDLLLFSSLFVLGGDFWDKIRGLFIHDAVVQIHQS
jgi:hypothetical protein